jgi:hypothetical protein
MKHSVLIALALSAPVLSFSQITITDSDMPDPGDSIRVSYASNLGPINPAVTDTNYTWDFSFLTPNAQERIEYITPVAFPFSFLSDVALTNYTPDSLPMIGQIPANFMDYYKSSNSSFRQNGSTFDFPQLTTFSVPIIYSASDYVYRFPLTYGNVDSCDAAYSLTIPGIGYIGQDRHRVNVVDGWGTLITPLDTYQVVRIRSVVDATDTISFDTTNQTGYSIPRPTEVQYKWMAIGMKIPVLEVDCQVLFNSEVISSIQYQDSLRDSLFQVSVSGINPEAPYVTVYPNPAEESVNVHYVQNSGGPMEFIVTDLSGKIMLDESNKSGNNSGVQQINVAGFDAGIYLIMVVSESGTTTSKIVVH